MVFSLRDSAAGTDQKVEQIVIRPFYFEISFYLCFPDVCSGDKRDNPDVPAQTAVIHSDDTCRYHVGPFLMCKFTSYITTFFTICHFSWYCKALLAQMRRETLTTSDHESATKKQTDKNVFDHVPLR